MAVCGSCGITDKEIEPDNDGNCVACGKDHWLEWGDFSTDYLIDWIKNISEELELSIPDLIFKVYQSTYASNKDKLMIRDIFEKFNLHQF